MKLARTLLARLLETERLNHNNFVFIFITEPNGWNPRQCFFKGTLGCFNLLMGPVMERKSHPGLPALFERHIFQILLCCAVMPLR